MDEVDVLRKERDELERTLRAREHELDLLRKDCHLCQDRLKREKEKLERELSIHQKEIDQLGSQNKLLKTK